MPRKQEPGKWSEQVPWQLKNKRKREACYFLVATRFRTQHGKYLFDFELFQIKWSTNDGYWMILNADDEEFDAIEEFAESMSEMKNNLYLVLPPLPEPPQDISG